MAKVRNNTFTILSPAQKQKPNSIEKDCNNKAPDKPHKKTVDFNKSI